MICGHCKESGPGVTVAHVRGCSGTPAAPAVPIKKPLLSEVTEGLYTIGERVIKIQIAHHGSGNMYGKELQEGAWERLVGAVRILQETPGAKRMTLEEAIKYGELYGRCIRCWRILTKESSIAQAMGDKCAGSF